MRKFTNPEKVEPLAEAPSVRKGEIFRATKHGVERLQTGKLRGGGKYNRMEELPYHRITSMTYEERIFTRGSLILSGVGILLLLVGLGVPALSTFSQLFSGVARTSNVSVLENALLLPDLAMISLGASLLAFKFPRRHKDGWWQIKGHDQSAGEMHGWQVLASQKGVENFIHTVKEGMSRANNQASTSGSRGP